MLKQRCSRAVPVRILCHHWMMMMQAVHQEYESSLPFSCDYEECVSFLFVVSALTILEILLQQLKRGKLLCLGRDHLFSGWDTKRNEWNADEENEFVRSSRMSVDGAAGSYVANVVCFWATWQEPPVLFFFFSFFPLSMQTWAFLVGSDAGERQTWQTVCADVDLHVLE